MADYDTGRLATSLAAKRLHPALEVGIEGKRFDIDSILGGLDIEGA